MFNRESKNKKFPPLLDRETSSDEEILAVSVSAPSVFEILVERHQASFLKAAMKIVRRGEDAQDVTQETFIKIYRNAGKFRKMEGADFQSWAYKILFNTAFNHYKKLKKDFARNEQFNPVYHDNLALARSFGMVDAADYERLADYKNLVARILFKLPKHLGEVLKKYYLEDKSQANIAEEEGVTITTIKMRLFRAKKEFRKKASADKIFSWAMI